MPHLGVFIHVLYKYIYHLERLHRVGNMQLKLEFQGVGGLKLFSVLGFFLKEICLVKILVKKKNLYYKFDYLFTC